MSGIEAPEIGKNRIDAFSALLVIGNMLELRRVPLSVRGAHDLGYLINLVLETLRDELPTVSSNDRK